MGSDGEIRAVVLFPGLSEAKDIIQESGFVSQKIYIISILYVPQVKVFHFHHFDIKKNIFATGCRNTDDNKFFFIFRLVIPVVLR